MADLSSWPANAPQTCGRRLIEKNRIKAPGCRGIQQGQTLQWKGRKKRPLHACQLSAAALLQDENNASDLQSCCDE